MRAPYIRVMPASYKDILAALPSLDRTQLEAIRKRCQALTKLGPAANQQPARDVDWLLRGIMTTANRRGLYVADMRNTSQAYKTQAAQVRELLEEGAPGLDYAERVALGEVAAEALVLYLQNVRRMEVSLSNLLMYVGQIPLAIEKEYPGYWECRLLGLTVRRANAG